MPSKKEEFDELNIHAVRYRPEELAKLASTTKFTRKEIQLIYRGFKQECPTGMVDEDSFKHIFSQFFPQGDASQYAHYVFNTIKHNHTNKISFEFHENGATRFRVNGKGTTYKGHVFPERLAKSNRWFYRRVGRVLPPPPDTSQLAMVLGPAIDFLGILSKVSRGSVQEKLQWIFGLYDQNGDGLVTKTEMLEVVSSIYDMLGRNTTPTVEEHSAKEHVERIFHLIDTNQDGVVTIDELVEWCSRDEQILQSLETSLDTVL